MTNLNLVRHLRTPSMYSFDRAVYDRAARRRRASGIGIDIGLGIGESGAAAAFNGDFSSVLSGWYTCVQGDKGIVEGPTPKASGTTPPVQSLTGTRSAAAPTPIWSKCTTAGTIGSGAVFSIYYDGAGVTPSMTGVTPSAGTPVALTGAGTGLSLAWAAGTAALDNVWKVTGKTWTDQSVAAHNFIQNTVSLQGVIGIGPNGKPCLIGDGVDDTMQASVTVPAPGTTPTTFVGVCRLDTWVGNTFLCGADGFDLSVGMQTSSPQIRMGSSLSIVGGPIAGTWARIISKQTNSASNFLKFGAISNTGASGSGNAGSLGVALWTTGGIAPGACSWAMFGALDHAISGAEITAFDAAVASWGAGTIAL